MIILLIGLLISRTSESSRESTTTISELNLRREEFDDREVVVRGYLWIGPEQIYVTDQRFKNDDAFDKASGCLSLVNVGRIESRIAWSGRYVEIKGRFVEKNNSYGVSLMTCGWSGLDLHGNPGGAIRLQKKSSRDAVEVVR
jgi:hypothetical protein